MPFEPKETWKRDIWTECNHWDHQIDKTIFEHYSSVPYIDGSDDEKHILWLSLPKGKKDFPTVVWFHGGGLTGSNHECPKDLYDAGEFAIVEPRYRLSPDVKAPVYMQDAAAALAWVLYNVQDFGGDPAKVFVGGMSAGAYLAMIISLNPQWLAPYGFSHENLAGIISLSGQVSTHFKVAEELGLPEISPYAPIAYLSKDIPPMLLVVGDAMRDIEGRTEENICMAAQLRKLGHTNIECHSLGNQDHSGAFIKGSSLTVPFIRKVLSNSW